MNVKIYKVYLCGGLVTDWQEDVITALQGYPVEFYDPGSFIPGGVRPDVRVYSPMDRLKIDDCDIIFAYLEDTNPTGLNVALELGYGKGRGKITIFVNEWTEKRYKKKELKTQWTVDGHNDASWFKPHYLDLVRSWVDFDESDFGLAIEILKKLVKND